MPARWSLILSTTSLMSNEVGNEIERSSLSLHRIVCTTQNTPVLPIPALWILSSCSMFCCGYLQCTTIGQFSLFSLSAKSMILLNPSVLSGRPFMTSQSMQFTITEWTVIPDQAILCIEIEKLISTFHSEKTKMTTNVWVLVPVYQWVWSIWRWSDWFDWKNF